ncbi:SusC/RagA family TonB-linked outer membrane protein [bacterium]|nr:SusC/RagA family TonB-linked outer membrane protein [bacterium]
MRILAKVIIFFTLSLTAGCLLAQSVIISGSVIDAETGQALVGANVMVIGETVGSATDEQGNFSFSMVLTGPVKLVASFMGYKRLDMEIAPGDVTTDLLFELEPDVIGTERVVVTALGLTQEEKALGYSQQQVNADELTEVIEPNIVSNLSGKVSGVQVVGSSGAIGSSARIQIRGVSSLTGDNQPLFVVDGVPINNAARSTSLGDATHEEIPDDPYGGYIDFGNAAADINPNDIKSVNVLKGANAAALYGSRALNGVVEITTKSGKEAGLVVRKGLGISYTNHIAWRTVNPQFKLQNKYGQGALIANDSLASYGEFAYFDGNYGGINDGTDESWGPPLDGYLSDQYEELYGDHEYIVVSDVEGDPLYITQYNSPLKDGTIDPSIATWDRIPTAWVSHPNNVKDFFVTGMMQEHNLSFYGGTMSANYRISLSHQDETGIMTNTDQTRNSVYLSGNLQLSRKLSVSGMANYVKTDNDNLVGNGYSGFNPMQQFTGWFGRQVDLSFLKKNIQKEDGTPYRWNYAYHNNPYWILKKNTNSRNRNRVFGNVSANYKFNSWISGTARVGTDWYRENIKIVRAMYTNDFPDGNFEDQTRFSEEINADLFFRANRKLTEDIEMTALVGANYRENHYKYEKIEVLGLIIPDLYSLSNASVKPVTDMDMENTEHNSVYGRLSLSFKDYLFLETTGRNDWSSTLPEDNRSYFYPSVTGSFIFSDFANIDPKDLFGKIRASWAVVGNTAEPYSLVAAYSSVDPIMGMPALSLENTLANADLKPEEKTSIELGTDLKVLNNRLGLSFTYYKENTINQIMSVDLPPSTGFNFKWINAGEIENKGVELSLLGTPVKTNDFDWDITVNWAKNENKVIKLYGDIEQIELWPSAWDLKVVARPGKPWGQMLGWPTLMHNGKPLVDEDGNYQSGADLDVVGNVLPDWTGGIRNTFRYKNISLSTLIDVSWGGDVFSVTNMFGMYAGILEESVTGADDGDPVTGNDIRREGGVIIDGYQEVTDEEGEVTGYVKNETAIDGYWYSICRYPALGGHNLSVYDATWIKLRSITLNYRIPLKYVSRFGLSGASIGLEGRNLFILYKKAPNIDPETGFSSNITQGIEQNQFPSTRMYGVSLKLDL